MRERTTAKQLEEVYDDTIVALFRYASRRCGGNRSLAEDVTQEVWLRAVKHWRRAGIPKAPLAWLTTVARNLIVSHLRQRDPLSLADVPVANILAAVENDAFSDSAVVASAVTRALDRMPAREAKLIEAFHYERCRISQIAADNGLTERAVEGRLRRARERLRRELELTLNIEGGYA
jgi:RNA polymerase sigma-70 factor, ECF subfamily